MQNNFTLPLKYGSIYEEMTKNVMVLSERADKGKWEPHHKFYRRCIE